MRLRARILCLLLSISVLLMPLGNLHAHISGLGDHHVNVHGGHSHDAGYDHDRNGGAHEHEADADKSDASIVVSLKPDLSQGSLQLWKAIQWLAVMSAFVIVIFELRPLRLSAKQPRTRTRPPSPYPHALPLLRGPPVSI